MDNNDLKQQVVDYLFRISKAENEAEQGLLPIDDATKLASDVRSFLEDKLSTEYGKKSLIFRKYDKELRGHTVYTTVTIHKYLAQGEQIVFTRWKPFLEEILKIEGLSELPKQQKFIPKGSFYLGLEYIRSILDLAKKSILIQDPWSDEKLLPFFKGIDQSLNLKIKILSLPKNGAHTLKSDLQAFTQEYPLNIEVGLTTEKIHARYIIIDESDVYEMTASFNTIGKDTSSIFLVDEPDKSKTKSKTLQLWNNAQK